MQFGATACDYAQGMARESTTELRSKSPPPSSISTKDSLVFDNNRKTGKLHGMFDKDVKAVYATVQVNKTGNVQLKIRYYAIDSWDSGEYGEIKINDVSVWKKARKNSKKCDDGWKNAADSQIPDPWDADNNQDCYVDEPLSPLSSSSPSPSLSPSPSFSPSLFKEKGDYVPGEYCNIPIKDTTCDSPYFMKGVYLKAKGVMRKTCPSQYTMCLSPSRQFPGGCCDWNSDCSCDQDCENSPQGCSIPIAIHFQPPSGEINSNNEIKNLDSSLLPLKTTVCTEVSPCKMCEGTCYQDSDCEGELKCYQKTYVGDIVLCGRYCSWL